LIEGKLVNLRALEEEDLELLKKWRNLDFVRKTTREYRLLDTINQKKWFETIHHNSPPREIMFGITNKNNKLIGVTGLTYIDWKNKNSEISIYIAKKNWQKTVEAKNTIHLILQYGFNELNIHRLWVEIYEIAKENIELFSKMKFKKEGVLRDKVWRDGKWWNSQIYSILKTEYSNE
jgi:RimJ/RimL family protein N-acetyltransferase